MDRDKLERALNYFGSYRKAGQALGKSHVTIAKYAKKYGLLDRSGRYDYDYSKRKRVRYGAVAKFMEENPDFELPRSYDKLSTIIGCSKDAIKCYVYRRRKEMREKAANLKDLRKRDILLQDVNGDWYSTEDFATYKVFLDKYRFCYIIEAFFDNGFKTAFTLRELPVP